MNRYIASYLLGAMVAVVVADLLGYTGVATGLWGTTMGLWFWALVRDSRGFRRRKPKPSPHPQMLTSEQPKKKGKPPGEKKRKLLNAKGNAAGFGACMHCGDTFDWKAEHQTRYSHGASGSEACFPLCEDCWQQLGTPEARLPYYDRLVNVWAAIDGPYMNRTDLYREAMGLDPHYEEKRKLIREAVLRGE